MALQFINIQLVSVYLFRTGNRFVTWLYKTDYTICQRQGLLRCCKYFNDESLCNGFRIYQYPRSPGKITAMIKQVIRFETLAF